ncbi:MAG: TatD family hydrolase [Sulfolobales archaeon]
MIFADAHLHSNPISGLGIRNIAKKFKTLGGWFIALISLPPTHYGLNFDLESHVKSIDILIRECRLAKEEGLKVRCLAGIHPADLEKIVNTQILRYEEALNLAFKVLDHVGTLIRNGLLDGIGEIGRPHYKTSPEGFIINEVVLRYGLRLARELDTIVHLHLEQGGLLTIKDLNEVLSLISIKRNSVLLHHLDIKTGVEANNAGLTFTVCGKSRVISECVKKLAPTYMVESDFIDDPRRPGVASFPWEIIENQLALLRDDVLDEDYLAKINIDNVVKFYGVDPP